MTCADVEGLAIELSRISSLRKFDFIRTPHLRSAGFWGRWLCIKNTLLESVIFYPPILAFFSLAAAFISFVHIILLAYNIENNQYTSYKVICIPNKRSIYPIQSNFLRIFNNENIKKISSSTPINWLLFHSLFINKIKSYSLHLWLLIFCTKFGRIEYIDIYVEQGLKWRMLGSCWIVKIGDMSVYVGKWNLIVHI